MKKRNPFIAAVLSFLAPGLGQIYNGKLALGVGFFVLVLALPFVWGFAGWTHSFGGLAALVLVSLFLWLFIIVRALFQARRVGEVELKKYQTPVVYALYILLYLGLLILPPGNVWMSSLGISPYRMMTASMMPTLQKDDLLMMDSKAYHDRTPKRGDLIVFKYPPDPSKIFVKRVVAFEGETIEIKNKQVFVDGKPLEEPYKTHNDNQVITKNDNYRYDDVIRDNFGPFIIPVARCFVLGDNRDFSADSRYWGALPLANITGQALYVYWTKDKKRIGRTLK